MPVMKEHHVRIRDATHRAIQEIATRTGESMSEVVARAVEQYRRELLFAEANAAWVALQADPEASAELAAEVAAWDATLADGLEPVTWER